MHTRKRKCRDNKFLYFSSELRGYSGPRTVDGPSYILTSIIIMRRMVYRFRPYGHGTAYILIIYNLINESLRTRGTCVNGYTFVRPRRYIHVPTGRLAVEHRLIHVSSLGITHPVQINNPNISSTKDVSNVTYIRSFRASVRRISESTALIDPLDWGRSIELSFQLIRALDALITYLPCPYMSEGYRNQTIPSQGTRNDHDGWEFHRTQPSECGVTS